MIGRAIGLALLGWAFTFGLPWGNFWVKIGLTVSAVCAYALACDRPAVRLRWGSVMTGLALAAVLYAVFFAGNALAPLVIPDAQRQVGGIYGMGEGSPRAAILLLLLLVTGPGEEIFWRGFLQEQLQRRIGSFRGFVVSTAVYTGVHVFSLNPMLMLAALVAGAFWGAYYLWKRDLAALMISHAVWSAVIFAVLPIR